VSTCPKLSAYFVVALLTSSLVGCGEKNVKSTGSPKIGVQATQVPDTPPKKRQRVLGLFGGYMSCGSNNEAPLEGTRMVRYLQLINAKSNADKSLAPVYVVSCFGLDAGKVNFISSEAPSKVNNLPISQFVDEFVDLVDRTEDPDLHVVGHSYGGWLSLQIADAIKDKNPPRSLTTIDPISHLLCTPPDVINSIIGNPVRSTCNQAPADLSQDSLQAISERTTDWLNFYQTDASLLHSGILTGADNIKLTYPGAPLDPHTQIADDSKVLSRILALVNES